ncbi:MAG: hypothetical protein ACYS76_02725 [Planctomycetota bacterium]|jgi:hypothetical protein
MKTKGCVLFLWMLLFLGCDKADISSERYDKLVQAIETKDWELNLRAIHELGQVSKDSLSAQGILIQELFSEDLAPELVDMRFFEVVNALAQTNASTVKKLISAYEQRKSPAENLERLLFVLGRMGPKAKPAVPFLLEQLEKHRNNPDMETFIRIVLANAGYESSENIGQILSALRNGAETGRYAALQTLAFVGPGQWVRGEAVRVGG